VVGLAFVTGKISRHATIGGATYFADSRGVGNVAVVAGLDAALDLTSHVSLVPTFRVLITRPGTPAAQRDPLGDQTSTGSLLIRYGAGARVAF
jgi:hypothetical protein